MDIIRKDRLISEDYMIYDSLVKSPIKGNNDMHSPSKIEISNKLLKDQDSFLKIKLIPESNILIDDENIHLVN